MSSTFHDTLRAVSGFLELPVVLFLIVLLGFAVFSIGWLLVEYFAEHRPMKVILPRLLDTLQKQHKAEVIEESGLNRRQKSALLELSGHPDFSKVLRESLAANLLEKEQAHYDRLLKLTDLGSKLGPMFGLLGTLIPLGPGILALGQGDTMTLSTSLLTAFDTTIAGLCVAAVCLIISNIRKRWYSGYMTDLETLMDCFCEVEDQ